MCSKILLQLAVLTYIANVPSQQRYLLIEVDDNENKKLSPEISNEGLTGTFRAGGKDDKPSGSKAKADSKNKGKATPKPGTHKGKATPKPGKSVYPRYSFTITCRVTTLHVNVLLQL